MKEWRDEFLWRCALQLIKKYRPKIIAVGGGIAKTSTKHAIGAVLKRHFKNEVMIGYGNLNTYMGVPLSILGFEYNFHRQSISWQWPIVLLSAWWRSQTMTLPKYLILEYGTDHPGDIPALVDKLTPDIAVLTIVTAAHLMNYPSLEAIADEESTLVKAVPNDGAVFLNNKDPFFDLHMKNVRAKHVVTIDVPNEEIAIGFARAMGEYFGIAAPEIEKSLGDRELPEGRFNQRQIGDWLVFDDTYNANPGSMEAALAMLKKMPGRKIAIIGTMKELGSEEREMHRQVGQLAHEVADVVIGVGDLADDYQPVIAFPTSDAAATGVFPYLQKGDSILVKGSRSVHMEKIIEALEKYEHA